jgi:hypothetical protein
MMDEVVVLPEEQHVQRAAGIDPRVEVAPIGVVRVVRQEVEGEAEKENRERGAGAAGRGRWPARGSRFAVLRLPGQWGSAAMASSTCSGLARRRSYADS